MQSKLKSLKFEVDTSIVSSLIIHFSLGMSFFILSSLSFEHPPRQVEIEVLDAVHASPQAIQVKSFPQKNSNPPKLRAIFGVSRKSVTTDDGEAAKLGNTLSKTPDQEVLKPSDADSLPVPTEDYLVSEMPTLAEEVRIPYPPDSKKKAIEGAVVMEILIDSTGRVREAKAISSPAEDLERAALTAVKNFKFKPARIQDKPVAVRIHYAYRFVFEP